VSHPFGDLLRQYRARKAGLSQTRLAELAGYDQAVLVRMSQGRKDLTGPSGRERVVRLMTVLRDEGALLTQDDANALLKAAGMSPLFEGQPVERALLQSLKAGAGSQSQTDPVSTTARMDNLPAQLTHFVGRAHEMDEVTRLLSETRLLTLTGSGGCGKTRLAIEVGASLVGAKHRLQRPGSPQPRGDASPLPSQPAFPDGVWLAQLAPLSDPALVADAVATTFGLRAANRPARELVTDYLLDKHLLLILDNCEHLIGACAELADALLRACPDLSLLTTSREPLDIPGEVTWRVPSLTDDEAVQLFAERARAARPDFAVTEQNRSRVAQVCRQLDNIPLAIQLAASRLRAFSVEQLAARLSDVFALLTAGNRTALPRQQTLRATIDWSYNLLTEEERVLLRTLSVFAGGWTLEAAEAVCVHAPPSLQGKGVGGIGVPALLDQLVNKSLVIAEECVTVASSSSEVASATGVRYHLLETIRQYAHEKLTAAGEHNHSHGRHLDYFAGLAQAAKPHLHGPQQVAWLDRLEAELDNLRAALEWAAQAGDVPNGERLIDGLWWMWVERGYCMEGRRWVEAVLPADRTGTSPAGATAGIASGWLANAIGLNARATADFARAVATAQQLGDRRLSIQADLGLGKMTEDEGQAVALLQEAARLAREGGLRWEELVSLELRGARAYERGDSQQAAHLLAEALAGFRELGDPFRVQYALRKLGVCAAEQGDYAQARQALEEAVALARELKSPLNIADPLTYLAVVSLYQGDGARGAEALRESVAIYHTVGNLERVGQCLAVAAGFAQARGDLQCAATLLGAAEHLWHTPESGRWREIRWEYDRRLPLVRATLDPAEFDQAWAEGQKMTLRQVMDEIAAM
jgi:non-specific serine/threonine protein kinase